ncbi:hypothetical protein VDQ94_02270 [Xanthomonas campestris pv. campestris]|uniref:hypothetical protein n=1 Tax=Xanthomonas campestris TaxID=339 RepID=UPI001E296FFB|nr:hypothetical protein [Xanthomonas campestris]MCC5067950.1 hypothetical protein [Xanthomonas campestris]MEB1547737.1 hypothetical protein [Xanthomonas campestris pv. campestris]MEB1552508.1 hypothetical protein [Xanthomonas campestris pv. campestris]
MNGLSARDSDFSSKILLKEIAWLIGLAAVAGIVFPLSRSLAGAQDADGVLTSLISTQKLTWYFWGQDRLANLLPALASPIHDLEWNLRFQIFLRSFASFLAPLGILLLLMRSKLNILLITVVADFFLGFSLRGYGLYNLYIQHNPFSPSLVMFALSAGALSGLRLSIGLPLAIIAAFIAYATNLALLIFILPFLVLCILFDKERRAFSVRLFFLQLLIAALAYLHAKYYGEHVTSFGLTPSLSAITKGWATFATHVRVWLLLILFVIATLAALNLRDRPAALAWCVAAGMPLAVCAMSCLTWLQMNSFDVRYYMLFVIVFVSCCSYLIVSALMQRYQVRPTAQRVTGVVVIAAIFAGCLGGLSSAPSELISQRWRSQAHAASRVALREHVMLVTGDFWDVWPAVFVAKQDLREQGRSDADLYGVAYRGHVFRKRIMGLIREKGEVTALCFQDNVDDCIRTTNMFVTGEEPVRYLPKTVRPVDLAGRKGLIYRITSKPAPPPDYPTFCLESVTLNQNTPHQIGRSVNGLLDNDRQRGFLMFGPYAYVPAGQYKLEVFGRSADVRGSWVDMGSGGGKTQYARAEVTPGQVGVIASMMLDVPISVGDAEIRVWTEDGDSVQLSGYRLEPVETEAPGCNLNLGDSN